VAVDSGKLISIELIVDDEVPGVRPGQCICVSVDEEVLREAGIDEDVPLSASTLGAHPIRTLAKALLEQRGRLLGKPFYASLPFHYHRVPAGMRKWYAGWKVRRGQARVGPRPFPAWPIEYSGAVLNALARKRGVPLEGVWPCGGQGTECGVVCVTHDVDTGKGYANLPAFVEVERKLGIRSTFNLCLGRYKVDRGYLSELLQGGFDLGLHGYNHDGRLPFLPEDEIRERLLWALRQVESIRPRSFRAPSLMSSPALYRVLEELFDCDSSVTDTDNYALAQVGMGCCFPYPHDRGKLLILPLTLPDDCQMSYLRLSPAEMKRLWLEKLDWLAQVGGIALFDFHPDPHWSGNPAMMSLMAELVEEIKRRGRWEFLTVAQAHERVRRRGNRIGQGLS
jgi:peptidoglycan/xylan/chitin deacetylase (PgdA/CDA1 family)